MKVQSIDVGLTLRIIRFVECQLDDNWRFHKGNSAEGGNVTLGSWVQQKERILIALPGAKIGVSVSENHGITLKFRNGAMVELDGDLLIYDISDTV